MEQGSGSGVKGKITKILAVILMPLAIVAAAWLCLYLPALPAALFPDVAEIFIYLPCFPVTWLALSKLLLMGIGRVSRKLCWRKCLFGMWSVGAATALGYGGNLLAAWSIRGETYALHTAPSYIWTTALVFVILLIWLAIWVVYALVQWCEARCKKRSQRPDP